MVSNIHRTIVKGQEGGDSKNMSVSDTYSIRHRITTHCGLDSNQVSNRSYRWAHHLTPECSIPGESPPLPPRTFFGRDELIERVVDLVENLVPIALIGAGGIGKTSIALAILHHGRIKQRFGHNRRFIRCDEFPASHTHLLHRLSEVLGAEVKNPENLAPLRTFLSSKEMLIVLDNAESILDPQGTDARKIYAVVEELSRFGNICICITSRISTTPPDFKYLEVPTLSMGAACDTFYRIYDSDDRSDVVNGILKQLDFHPLSITLLATVAHQNKWTMNRLSREWGQRRTSVLQTQHNTSLAATIELSLASPLFQELGPDARALLGVIAFFPQGVDENNLEWLFPTISNRTDVFDKFCILSLTSRSDGFITMLMPLRDYLSPKDPKTSPLLCATKDRYFTRMSVYIDPDKPSYGESRWITSEDVNVEYLLDVFTTIDANSDGVWDACIDFMRHLNWHKERLTILKPKIEGLRDDHRSKPECLFRLSWLFGTVGDWVECKRLFIHALKLWGERGSDDEVAKTLMSLSETNRIAGFPEEGIQWAREALEIYQRLGNTIGQTECLIKLGWALRKDNQFNAAEEAALRAIALLPEQGEQFRVCKSHRLLGDIYQSKGNTNKAIHHFELALGIASAFGWNFHLFWIHYSLAVLFRDQGRLDDANAYTEHARSHTADNAYNLGCVVGLQAGIWYRQHRLEEARSEALRAVEIYEKLGAAKDTEDCRELLQKIEKELNTPVASSQASLNCEFL
jgi:tetratricopeptide (TPR) repeat protein